MTGHVRPESPVTMLRNTQVSIVLLDEGWGKAPVQIDVQARANFTDFLRDVGLAATSAHDHPDGEVVE